MATKDSIFKPGFTIVELLVVIVVIAILASISVAAYGNITLRARDTERKSDVASIAKAIHLWTLHTGKNPHETGGGFQGRGHGWYAHKDDANYTTSIQEVITQGPAKTTYRDDNYTSLPWSGGYMFYACRTTNTYAVFTHLEAPSVSELATMDSWAAECPLDPDVISISELKSAPFYMNYAFIFRARV